MPASLHVVDVVVVVVVVADENDEKKITSHVRERLTLNCVNEREMERERESFAQMNISFKATPAHKAGRCTTMRQLK